MKYPVVLFLRHDQYKYIDPIIDSNREKLECTVIIANNVNELNKLYDNTANVLITYGENTNEYISWIEPHFVPRLNSKWIHMKTMDISTFNYQVNYCYIHNVLQPRAQNRPTFSLFTSSYNSYHKIVRAYKSLLLQTYQDWEWIIVDDSPDDHHFEFLKTELSNNHKIRIYRRAQNSGSIGNVKNEAIGLCRGTYVVEFDHDDELMPDCLDDAKRAFETNPNVGFVYMDCCNIYENGENFKYSDFISYGYGGYYSTQITIPSSQKQQWVYVYVTPNVNNITAYALIALPNHPRIWKRDVLNALGSYCEHLPICDDLEILQKTFADSTIEVVKIHTLGYIQYMNDNNNNFSLIRNREINRIGPQYIAPMFYETFKMHQLFMERGGYEDEHNLQYHVQLWKRPASPYYIHKYINTIHNWRYTQQVCVLGLLAWEHYSEIIQTHLQTSTTLVVLLETDIEPTKLWEVVHEKKHSNNIWCYSLKDCNYNELHLYFQRLLQFPNATVPPVLLELKIENNVDNNDEQTNNNTIAIQLPDYNTRYGNRWEIINAYAQPHQTYLEIGVEYGTTFCNVLCENKTGVDPSHKFKPNTPEYYQIQTMTSDMYFSQYQNFAKIIEQSSSQHHFQPRSFRKFDIVFIDGMHHVENVVKDLNNSLKYSNDAVTIYLDDILPLNKEEQEKIPRRHKIEDGILKYVSPWTGDVWKVVYYLLQHHSKQFQYIWFHHPNYRGVLMMHHISHDLCIPENVLETINQYDYECDFHHYLQLLQYGGSGGSA